MSNQLSTEVKPLAVDSLESTLTVVYSAGEGDSPAYQMEEEDMTKRNKKSGKNSLYWAYNLPLQIKPLYEDYDLDEKNPIGYDVLNYRPRKADALWLPLEELLGEQTPEEFLLEAAKVHENLARLFREAARSEKPYVYYPDNGMEKAK